jgi:predicted ATP-dependent endonuclease of OLD family
MQPISIKIENYRSISEVTLYLENLSDGSRTFGLIGVNEAGKSSILRAIALLHSSESPTIKDYRDTALPIVISVLYEVDNNSQTKLISNVDVQDPDEATLNGALLTAKKVLIATAFDSAGMQRNQTYFALDQFEKPTKLSLAIVGPTLMSRSIFWTAEKKYLITEPVNLDEFSSQPDSVSIPLKNCFNLAGYQDIKKAVSDLRESTDKEHLQDTLGESVTRHILAVWPGHPIKITFSIDNRMLSFHVKDTGSTAKAKTADQRSDGFKQFISFLLTISAENINENLTNAILLIDEPETHLHPKAQEYLLHELKKITATLKNNLALFATHSPFLIDKKDLSRYYRITKEGDQTTVERLSRTAISYCEVNFRVFGIYSTDFHSELYSRLHLAYQAEDEADDKRAKIKPFDKGFFHENKKIVFDKNWLNDANAATLPTYIRNCINHPDNGHKYSEEELARSTDLMLGMLI